MEMLRRDPVVGAEQPCVQVAEREVNHRQMHICLGLVALNSDGHVAVAERRQRGISDPAVRPHFCAGRDVRLDEGYQRLLPAVGHDLQPQTARNNTPPISPQGVRWNQPANLLLIYGLRYVIVNLDSSFCRLELEKNVA